jgi:hypothetical protein
MDIFNDEMLRSVTTVKYLPGQTKDIPSGKAVMDTGLPGIARLAQATLAPGCNVLTPIPPSQST